MSRRRGYSITNAATSGGRAQVRLFDAIGGWFGISAREFADDLDALDADAIDLRVNSPGGDVFDGLAIMNALRTHKAHVTAYVDGMAASAASFIVVGGADEVVMSPNTEVMIHEPSGITMGDSALHRDTADRLDKIGENIASIYHRKAGGTLDEWREAMRVETWYSAEEAVKAGLADRVDGDEPDEPVENRWDLSVYNYAGRSKAPAPRTPGATAHGSKHDEQRSEPVAFTPEQVSALRHRLGLAADADESKIVATVTEVMEDYVKDKKDEQPAAPAPGTVLVDEAVLADLRAKAEQGVQAFAAQQQARREGLVDAAVRDGRIRAADRDRWLNDLALDPQGREATLASLTPGLAIPVGEIGHAGSEGRMTVNDAFGGDPDALYAAVFGADEQKGA